jgi:DNA-binding beta-propeller fold protein YncE
MKVNAGSTEATEVLRFRDGESPSSLSINGSGDTVYFLNRNVYRMSVYGETPAVIVESPYGEGSWGGFYRLSVDPVTSQLYVTDAIDFSQPGLVYRFTPGGEPLDTIEAGIVPGALCFTP